MKELLIIDRIKGDYCGLITAIGIILSVFFAEWLAKKRGIKTGIMFNLAIVIIISGIIGARLFYVLLYNPSFYFSYPMEIFKLTEGGVSIHGGLLVAVVSGYIYSVRVKISFFILADISVVAVAIIQGIAIIGCDVFNKVMIPIIPWGISVGDGIFHPAQMYKFVLDYILFIILWRKSEKQKYEGQLFVIYIIGFPIIRGVVGFFRINLVIGGFVSISHLISLVFIIIGLMIYAYLKSNDRYKIKNVDSSITPMYFKIISLIFLITFYTFQR